MEKTMTNFKTLTNYKLKIHLRGNSTNVSANVSIGYYKTHTKSFWDFGMIQNLKDKDGNEIKMTLYLDEIVSQFKYIKKGNVFNCYVIDLTPLQIELSKQKSVERCKKIINHESKILKDELKEMDKHIESIHLDTEIII